MKTKYIYTFLSIVATFLIGIVLIRNGNSENGFVPPLDKYSSRPKLLKFGMYVTPDPKNNPIDPPERFSGYHTGLDLEILPGEDGKDVVVHSACEGPLKHKGEAEGYGGLLVQTCKYRDEEVTVLYGHVDPGSVGANIGDRLKAGQRIAILGDNKSAETSFTRKHLHFQIHKGEELQLLGYVQNQSELADYLDPEEILK
jgi:murein DD-endopeptidase MepM/ murein hydrolase activator NlpD